jgi:hypothetical protein
MIRQFEMEKSKPKAASFFYFFSVFLVLSVPFQYLFYFIFGEINHSLERSILHSLLTFAPAYLLAGWLTGHFPRRTKGGSD